MPVTIEQVVRVLWYAYCAAALFSVAGSLYDMGRYAQGYKKVKAGRQAVVEEAVGALVNVGLFILLLLLRPG